MKKMFQIAAALLLLSTLVYQPSILHAQGTAFTYQGTLSDGGSPANGSYDLTFALFDAVTNGLQRGVTLTNTATPVTNGQFSVTLDFGATAFDLSVRAPRSGIAERWLELAVTTNGGNAFATLAPRQLVTPVPYAIFANTASNLSGTVGANQLSGRLQPAQLPPNAVLNGQNGVVLNGNFNGNFNGGFSGNGAGLNNLNASQLTAGTVPLAQLPSSVVLDGASGVTLSGAFSGDGSGLSNVTATAQLPANVLTNGAAGVNLAGTFSGDASGLTNLNAAQLNGTLLDAVLSSNVTLLNGTNSFEGSNTFAGVLIATNPANQIFGSFVGSGAGLTSLTAANLTGSVPSASLTSIPSANLTGTVPDAILSSNLVLRNGTNLFGGSNTFAGVLIATNPANQIIGSFGGDGSGLSNVTATVQLPANLLTNDASGVTLGGTFSGNGSGLTGLNASQMTGALPDAVLSSNVALLNGSNMFGGSNTFAGVLIANNPANQIAGSFNGNGSGLTGVARLSGGNTFIGNQYITNGNVGIGTTTPTNALDVTGNGIIPLGRFKSLSDNPASAQFATPFRSWRIGQNKPPDGPTIFDSWFIYDESANATRLLIDTAGNVGIGTNHPTSKLEVTGTVKATAFVGTFTGNGVGLTSLTAANLTGSVPSASLTSVPAANLTGIVADERLSANVPLLNGTNLFTGASNTFAGTVRAAAFIGNGAGLTNLNGSGFTNLNASQITSGTLADAQLSTNVALRAGGNSFTGNQTISSGNLVVNGSQSATIGANRYLDSGGIATGGGGSINCSIYASANVAAAVYFAFSDARIKRIAGRSDSSSDLQTLLGIQVTDYTYVDTVAKGDQPQKKVIAQQVEQVYPQAVSRTTDVVPDIYQKATIREGWVQLATDLKAGERVKLIGENEEGIYSVLEVRDGAFRTDFAPTDGKVFVYGREVKDFRTVDYEAIAMLNVSATQELKKEKDAEIAELKRRLDKLEQVIHQINGGVK